MGLASLVQAARRKTSDKIQIPPVRWKFYLKRRVQKSKLRPMASVMGKTDSNIP